MNASPPEIYLARHGETAWTISRHTMQRLIAMKDRFDVAWACDTDHDRHGIVCRSSGLLNPNHFLAVAISYLFSHRSHWPEDAGVGKTVVSSSLIDRVVAKLGRHLFEVPVGFKWFVNGFLDGSLAFGEEDLRRLIPYAPLHLPAEIQGIEAVSVRFPQLPQVACFDTAFHRRMPELAQRFPLPRAFWDEGVRRYDFHGLSYEYIIDQVGAMSLGRAVIAHLGNGASMAAVHNGQPVDTTKGFTPTGGFMMGTRAGDLDPGLLIYLLTEQNYDADTLGQLLNDQSGLLGVSGISPDLKTLLERREHDAHAAQAIDMFCYQLRKTIGALSAALDGLDTLVFTGGIGEHAAPVRWEVCRGLAHLGIQLDSQQNDRHATVISSAKSHCMVRVVPTNGDLMIARHTRILLFSTIPAPSY